MKVKFGEIEIYDSELHILRMEGMKRLEDHLRFMADPAIKEFTKRAFQMAPMYFWVIPSARGKKHHPDWTKRVGGLVLHVDWAGYNFRQLSETYKFNCVEFDHGLSATLLHDLYKYGPKEYDESFAPYHSFIPRRALKKLVPKIEDFQEYEFDSIMNCIETHMGNLSDGDWSGTTPMKPETDLQKAVHLADYMASRRGLKYEREGIE